MTKSRDQFKTAWMRKGVINDEVHAIQVESVKPSELEVSSQSGFEVLCTYNWQLAANKENVIFVPGGPPKWTPLPLPVTLKKDTGHQMVDQNGYRVPKWPFEPAFRALFIMKPDMAMDDVDVMANRNSLRKLLDFAAGRRLEPFRMDLHMVKNTLVMTRKEKNDKQMIFGPHNPGYGHNFEKAFTTASEGLDNSASHHRVIRYHLGNLNCVVRFEVDAYYDDPDKPDVVIPSTENFENVTAAMTQLSVDTSDSSSKDSTRVVIKGHHVSSSNLAEVKAKKAERLNQSMPQLWFGRTPYLITGRHNDGAFHDIKYNHVGKLFSNWEAKNQEGLRKLVSLITEIRDAVRNMPKRSAALIHEHKGGPLEIFEVKNASGVLSEDMLRRYWSFEAGGA